MPPPLTCPPLGVQCCKILLVAQLTGFCLTYCTTKVVNAGLCRASIYPTGKRHRPDETLVNKRGAAMALQSTLTYARLPQDRVPLFKLAAVQPKRRAGLVSFAASVRLYGTMLILGTAAVTRLGTLPQIVDRPQVNKEERSSQRFHVVTFSKASGQTPSPSF